MQIIIWGTRGSFPSTLQAMTRYGGNTTCVEVRTNAGDIIILDAGTGIQALGKHLCSTQKGGECAICFTHKHWDHVHGLTSFRPLYDPEWTISMFGSKYNGATWTQTLETLFDGYHFPMAWEHVGKTSHIKEFEEGDSFTIGSALIETCATCHPGGCVAYKITADGWTFFFSGDHEWLDEASAKQEVLGDFMSGANIALVDAHFKLEEYLTHKGWGHSTMEHWVEHALNTDVKRLIFTHHNPDYTDATLDNCLHSILQTHPDLPMKLVLAREGMSISAQDYYNTGDNAGQELDCTMCDFSYRVSRYTDPCLVLESVLTEARGFGQADAGTIYLINEDDKLAFAYAQNETLFPGSAANKMTYLNATIPKDTSSIAGYVAATSIPLNIGDAYSLSDNVPYIFNKAFDIATGYRTVSMLAVPLIASNNEVVGVLQLINHIKNGRPHPFTLTMQNQLSRLAVTAADSIERSRLSNELIVRMLETSALRDPTETAGHVMRVGAMAAEAYHRWAEKHSVPAEELRKTRDTIRLAAMLHDVGKVGVPDAVLKKPGKLTSEEFAIMRTHCAMGASLFKKPSSQLDIMAYNIALHHHQKWNGQGYTGDPEKPCLGGTDIPLEARITAVADVYDALVSKRCYKDPMTEDDALAILQKDAGTHFDPEVVDAFLEIKDVIYAIHEHFND